MKMLPKLSLIYPTKGRPEKCFDQIIKWLYAIEKNIPKNTFEFIVCIPEIEIDVYAKTLRHFKHSQCVKFIFNRRPKIDYNSIDFTDFDARDFLTSVTSYNDAAAVSLGEWIVCIADDLNPKDDFVDCLFDSINNVEKSFGKENCYLLSYSYEDFAGVVKHPIMNRAYFNQTRRIFHPAYIHEYADADLWMESSLNFGLKSMLDSLKPCVIHDNPMLNYQVEWDSIYSNAHNAKASEYCKRVFERRVKELVGQYSSAIFIERTNNKIQLQPEDQLDIMAFVDEILTKVKEAPPTVVISQPKRKDSDVPIQELATNNHITLPFGMNCKLATVHGKLVDEARNILIDNAINMGAKYMIFVDDDTALPRDGLGMLIQTSKRLGDVCAVGGVCAIKGSSNPAISSIDENGRLYTPDCKPSFEPLEVNWATGAACLLLPIEMLKKMKEQHPKMPFCWWAKKDGKKVVGEDIFLCARILKAGFKIYIDRRVQCLHFDMAKKEYYSYMPVDEGQYKTIFGNNIKRAE
jgi:hypothetical protein